ncbi:hypothetical protein SAMN05421743_10969 [Thalassobacillus cyri]|uniref:Uncharacterized protein n=1 Tax=Thalassobacillus cyri TaxID=571932 RepID=A0A1H4EHS2_9BACI|nr:hypothetical protein [Thalassobacillus cyri]SEA84407.1 hypothetical protein SAMN05421743_10969 [Thalassobacillus cyri]
MKRSYVGVLILAAILLMNIVFTQLVVHQYYYENYGVTLLYAGLNILLFPVALFVYKNEKNKGGSKGYEK